jgi:hypothetical protein
MKYHARGFDILCKIINGPTTNHLPKAEDPLGAGYLGVKELRSNGIPLARPPKGAADRCEKHLGPGTGFRLDIFH